MNTSYFLKSFSFVRSCSKHYSISQIQKTVPVGSNITVNGWIRKVRKQKNVSFFELNDGTTLKNFQVIADDSNLIPTNLSFGCSVTVKGELVSSPLANQSKELKSSDITVVGTSDESYPIHQKKHSMDFLRQNSHMRPRTRTFGAILRIRNAATMAIHKILQKEEFLQIHTPILTGNDCEGAGDMFSVFAPQDLEKIKQKDDKNPLFFNTPSFLTVSGQLDAEIFASSMSKIYTFGPTFRAEKSETPRHLSEFWMMEPEIAFFDMNSTINFIQNFLTEVNQEIFNTCEEDILFCHENVAQSEHKLDLKELFENKKKYEIITYTEAIDLLEKSNQNFEFPIKWGLDLQREHEKYICEDIFNNNSVFITNWPKKIKPFYMKQDENDNENEDTKTVAAFDLIVPRIGELIGGSQRENDLKKLKQNMKLKKINQEMLHWYLDLRKYGSVPHSGFGLGFERYIQFITGIPNIKDTIPLPRYFGNCKF